MRAVIATTLGGWQLVGVEADETVGGLIVLDPCAVACAWGATTGDSRGLGLLAREGPQGGAALDYQPRTEILFGAVIHRIIYRTDRWAAAMAEGERIDEGVSALEETR